MKYNIKKLTPNESILYRNIRLEALKAYPKYFGSNYEEQAKLEKLYFEKIIAENSSKGIMIGAFIQNTLIAICGVSFQTTLLKNSAEIIQMYVRKEHQGNGIGQQLMAEINKIVSVETNIETLVLGVDKNNIAAIKTYTNCGFEINDKIKDDDVFYMSLSIA